MSRYLLRFAVGFLALASVAHAQRGTRGIHVQVTGADGRAIAGAQLLRTLSVRSAYPSMLLSRAQFPLAELLARVKTDARGRGELPIPPSRVDVMAPPRSAIFVSAAGCVTDCLAVLREDMPAGPDYAVRLLRSSSVSRHRIFGLDGKAVRAGIELRAIGVRCGERIALVPDELIEVVKTDAEGRAEFRRLRRASLRSRFDTRSSGGKSPACWILMASAKCGSGQRFL